MEAEKAEVLRMIQQIRDRLDDVEESLGSYTGDLDGYAKRLDRIDDRLFEIEEEFEAAPDVVEEVPDRSGSQAEAALEAVDEEEPNEFDPGISREGVQQATDDMNAIYKTGASTVAEIAGAVNDIKSAFDFKSLLK